jgi:hypothetical protein
MGQLTLGEQAAPSTPASGNTIYTTVATPSILRVINDSGTDTAIARVTTALTTWTPGVSFGGGTTGLTYSSQVGRYCRIGDVVFATGLVTLSAKGSSTGTALITGLPVASANVANVFHAVSLRANVMATITGDLMGFIGVNSTDISLEYLGTGTRTLLTDVNFNNTSTLIVTAVYMVA